MAIHLPDLPLKMLPEFEPIPGVWYKHDYNGLKEMYKDAPVGDQLGVIRKLCLSDLFFLLYFMTGFPKDFLPKVNREFVVKSCYEVQNGPDGDTLDLWARFHFKTTIRTARLIQRILKAPEKCHMIASYNRPTAKKFLRPIKNLFSSSVLLKACFPDVLYANPEKDAPKWSEDDGITVIRQGVMRKESTVEAWGVIEGMPTGSHFDFIDVDDLETKDTVKNPDVAQSVNDSFDLLFDLLTEGGKISVWGTPYGHAATYFPFVVSKVNAKGETKFKLRRKPATSDGSRDVSKSVLLDPDELAEIFAGKSDYIVNCQQLINPTPMGTQRLNARGLQEIEHRLIPVGVLRFLLVDPAGDLQPGKKKGNAWAIMRIGVQPESDGLGLAKCYIEDAVIKPMGNTEATETAARMYVQGGIINRVGIEKTGMTTFHQHLSEALAKQGRYISTDNKTLVLLSHGGSSLESRVLDSLEWPLNNSKWFISKDIPLEHRQRLYSEMEKFPHFHPDGLVAMAYLYELLKDFHFGGAKAVKAPSRPRQLYGVR